MLLESSIEDQPRVAEASVDHADPLGIIPILQILAFLCVLYVRELFRQTRMQASEKPAIVMVRGKEPLISIEFDETVEIHRERAIFEYRINIFALGPDRCGNRHSDF